MLDRTPASAQPNVQLQWEANPKPAEPAQLAQPVPPVPEKSRLEELMEEEKLAEQSTEKKPKAEMAANGWTEVEESQYDRVTQNSGEIYIHPHNGPEDVTVVAATAGPEDTSWIEEFCDEFQCTPLIYSLDEYPWMDHYYTTYSRKGHEASAYLTYIIDHYDNLAPYTIFIHGRSDQWHNDIAGPHTRNILPNLRVEAVALNGYVNLRCTNRPGCPSTLFQAHPVTLDYDYVYLIDQLPRVLNEMLGTALEDVPEDFGHQCCAQFALSRERILQRPRSDYIRILNWIATTDMTDNYGIGWMVEKLWHYIFGMPAVQ
ncbi:hypothetical protein N7470_005955 [Penicillium chermesinum]|nr:hypothetical protein N7470_005955 [Penicillium chermesinum]